MYTRIERELSDYEQSGRYRPSSVIHGDPVFSNVLLTKDGRIFLLDMRGELGSVLTLQGDLAYDLSKVYQSLLGYDFIILGQPLHERDAELLEELRHTFRAFVRENYPEVLLSDVVKITASHFFGIVPLHVNRCAADPVAAHARMHARCPTCRCGACAPYLCGLIEPLAVCVPPTARSEHQLAYLQTASALLSSLSARESFGELS